MTATSGPGLPSRPLPSLARCTWAMLPDAMGSREKDSKRSSNATPKLSSTCGEGWRRYVQDERVGHKSWLRYMQESWVQCMPCTPSCAAVLPSCHADNAPVPCYVPSYDALNAPVSWCVPSCAAAPGRGAPRERRRNSRGRCPRAWRPTGPTSGTPPLQRWAG